MKIASLTFLIALAGIPAALAQEPATTPAAVDSDYAPIVINPDVKKTPINTRSHQLEAKVSLGDHSALSGTAARVQAAGGQKFILKLNDHMGPSLYAGAAVKADLGRSDAGGPARLQNLEVRALGAALMDLRVDDRVPGPYLVNEAGRVDREFQASCYDANYGTLNPVCLKLRPANVPADQALAWFKSEHEAGRPLFVEFGPQPGVRPSLTGSARFLTAHAVYDDQKTIRASAQGARLNMLDASGHVAFTVQGLPIDLCAQAAAGTTLGAIQTLDHKRGVAFDAELRACAGVQLGQIGRLGYDYRVAGRYVEADKSYRDGSWVVNQSHELSLRKIGGSPMMVSGSIETARAATGDTRTERGQTVQSGSALETSAKFITVGGEF